MMLRKLQLTRSVAVIMLRTLQLTRNIAVIMLRTSQLTTKVVVIMLRMSQLTTTVAVIMLRMSQIWRRMCAPKFSHGPFFSEYHDFLESPGYPPIFLNVPIFATVGDKELPRSRSTITIWIPRSGCQITITNRSTISIAKHPQYISKIVILFHGAAVIYMGLQQVRAGDH